MSFPYSSTAPSPPGSFMTDLPHTLFRPEPNWIAVRIAGWTLFHWHHQCSGTMSAVISFLYSRILRLLVEWDCMFFFLCWSIWCHLVVEDGVSVLLGCDDDTLLCARVNLGGAQTLQKEMCFSGSMGTPCTARLHSPWPTPCTPFLWMWLPPLRLLLPPLWPLDCSLAPSTSWSMYSYCCVL